MRAVEQTRRSDVPPTSEQLRGKVEVSHVGDARNEDGSGSPVLPDAPEQLAQLGEDIGGLWEVLEDVEEEHRSEWATREQVNEAYG